MEEKYIKFYENFLKVFDYWSSFFFSFLVFMVPLFFQDQTMKQTLPWVFLAIWGIYYFFLRKKLLKKLDD